MRKERTTVRLNASTDELVTGVMEKYNVNKSVALDLLINASNTLITSYSLDSYYEHTYSHMFKHGNAH